MLFLQEARDWVIIVSGGLLSLLLAVALVFTVVIGLTTRSLLRTVKTLLDTEVHPLLQTTRQTMQQVRGTTTFVSEKAVRPLVRTYGFVAGVRRALTVLGGLTGRRGHRRQ